LVVLFGEIVAEPIEAALPSRPPSGDPSLDRPQRRRLDATGPHPPDLLGADDATGFQNM
jgi:hypothetical protein